MGSIERSSGITRYQICDIVYRALRQPRTGDRLLFVYSLLSDYLAVEHRFAESKAYMSSKKSVEIIDLSVYEYGD